MGRARVLAWVGAAMLAVVAVLVLAWPAPDALHHAGRRGTAARTDRRRRALEARIRNEAVCCSSRVPKEGPKDAEVLVASDDRALVYINLGRRNGLRPDALFVVWRLGRDRVREEVAVIRVARVDRTSAEARITKRIADGVPIVAGMSVSNPFFASRRPLRVYLARDLVPRDDAYRAIDLAGARAVPELDDTVNVIVARDIETVRGPAERIGALVVPEADLERYAGQK